MVVDNLSVLDEVRDDLLSRRVLGVDTETTGPYMAGDKRYSLSPWNPGTRMVLAQIGTEDMTYLLEPDLVPEFKDILESESILHLLHNASYDFKWMLIKYGIHITRMYCSMLAEQLLTAGIPAMRVTLGDSVRRRPPYWLISKAIRDLFTHLDHVDGCPDCLGGQKKLTAKMGYYAARDIPLLFPLFREEVILLKKWKMQLCAQDEFDVIPAVCEMEIGGVCLDQPTLKQIIDYWIRREKQVSDKILKLYDSEIKKKGKTSDFLFPEMAEALNLKSNTAKLEALRNLDLDLENIKRDALKNIGKGFIERKVGHNTVKISVDFTPEQRELAKLLAEYSNIVKMTSTYGQNMLDKINKSTGLWHPGFFQMGSGEMEGRKSNGEGGDTTATGRMSGDAQQFPKPETRYEALFDPDEIERVKKQFANQIAAVTKSVVENSNVGLPN